MHTILLPVPLLLAALRLPPLLPVNLLPPSSLTSFCLPVLLGLSSSASLPLPLGLPPSPATTLPRALLRHACRAYRLLRHVSRRSCTLHIPHAPPHTHPQVGRRGPLCKMGRRLPIPWRIAPAPRHRATLLPCTTMARPMRLTKRIFAAPPPHACRSIWHPGTNLAGHMPSLAPLSAPLPGVGLMLFNATT